MLEIEGVSAGYSAIPVLKGVSISVAAGEFVSVVGPNGAGKSTLFKTISGVLQPTAGSIRFEGADLMKVVPSRRPHLGIAHVPEGRHVFSSLTVMENLELGAYTESGRRHWKSSIDQIFQLFPVLSERRRQFAGTLSGGEQQMLAIGRILRTGARLLLLDEPTEGLAPVIIQQIGRTIGMLKAQGFTILLVEQNFHFAATLADRYYVMEHGRIVDEFSAAGLQANMEKVHDYLGV